MALPEATERPSHGAPTWFIAGKKTFVTFHNDHHGDGILGLVVRGAAGRAGRARRRGARPVLRARVRRAPRLGRRAPRSQPRLERGRRDHRRRVPHRRRPASPQAARRPGLRQSTEHGLGLGHERDELVVRVAELGLHDDRGAPGVEWPCGAAQRTVTNRAEEVGRRRDRRRARALRQVEERADRAETCRRASSPRRRASDPAVVHRSGVHSRWPRTSSFDAASISIPTATANGIVATSSARSIPPS